MKKMKYNIVTIIVLVMSFSFIACEDKLEPYIYGSINNEDAFKTIADVEANITSIYHGFRRDGWGAYMFSNGSSFVMDEVCTEDRKSVV